MIIYKKKDMRSNRLNIKCNLSKIFKKAFNTKNIYRKIWHIIRFLVTEWQVLLELIGYYKKGASSNYFQRKA